MVSRTDSGHSSETMSRKTLRPLKEQCTASRTLLEEPADRVPRFWGAFRPLCIAQGQMVSALPGQAECSRNSPEPSLHKKEAHLLDGKRSQQPVETFGQHCVLVSFRTELARKLDEA